MIALVTDRTAADVNRLRELTRKALSGTGATFAERLTDAERAEWLAASNKGAYNASDLNRVGQACQELYEAFTDSGYELPSYYQTPTNWSVTDVPYGRMMAYYIGNVAAIKAALDAETDVPDTMDGLDFYGANAIERLLLEADALLNRLKLGFIYSGEIYSGEF